ncbi:MAG: hypothetical protein SNJ77_11810 [Cytophagales bacterium]
MKRILITLLLILGLLGCIKPPDIPKEPHIEFKEIFKTSSNDSLNNRYRIVFYFRDGDGDIGIKRNEQGNKPFDLGTDPDFNPYYRNLWVVMQVKRNNEYKDVRFNLPGSPDINFFGLNQTIEPPMVDALEQKRAIEGHINFDFEIRISDVNFFNPNFAANRDSVRFKLTLVDRAFNKSNEIFTDPVLVITPRANGF